MTSFALVLATAVRAALASQVEITVNDAGDRGDGVCDGTACTLREALTQANSSQSPTLIRFQLRGTTTIRPLTALPTIGSHISVDGRTQAGAKCPIPGVQIDGVLLRSPPANQNVVDGLRITGNSSALRGLAITNFPGNGVVVRGHRNTLQCLNVGVDLTGLRAAGNGGHGIVVESGALNQLGGPDTRTGNLIGANTGIGVRLVDAAGTRLGVNHIGVDIFGKASLPNGNGDPSANDAPPISTLPPDVLARLEEMIAAKVSMLRTQANNAVLTSGVFEKYTTLLGPSAPNKPTNLLDLWHLLISSRQDLAQPFAREITAINERSRTQAALSLERARRTLGPSPRYLQEVAPYNGPRPLAAAIESADPHDITVAGAPTTHLALQVAEGDLPLIPLSPFIFSYLKTAGPTTFASDPYEALDFACTGPAPCTWPIVYDLRPREVDLVFETDDYPAAEVAKMVAEDGYFISVRLNGSLLTRGPADSEPGASEFDDYSLARLPNNQCPNLTPCIMVAVRARTNLPGVNLPWTFELRIERLESLDVPQIIGVDEFGNPIIVTERAIVFNRSMKRFNPNTTNNQSWFVAAMEETFRSDRCVDCHSFGTFEALAQHHTGNLDPVQTQAFINAQNMQLIPSLYAPGKHVITCSNCHNLPLTDPFGTPFHETQWLAPYVDLDVNWSTKSAAQICTRVKQNLPSMSLRHLHFHGDARLYWAVEDPTIAGLTTLHPPAEPQDYNEFLRRIDVWNAGGAPCP